MDISQRKIEKSLSAILEFHKNKEKGRYIKVDYLFHQGIAADINECKDIAETLKALGLIEIRSMDLPGEQFVFPTDSGTVYFVNKRNERKRMWNENVKMPFIVAFLTYLLLDGIKWLFPHLLKWLSSLS